MQNQRTTREEEYFLNEVHKDPFQGEIADNLLILMKNKKWVDLHPEIQRRILVSVRMYSRPWSEQKFTPFNVVKLLRGFYLGAAQLKEQPDVLKLTYNYLIQTVLSTERRKKDDYITLMQTIVYANKLGFRWPSIVAIDKDIIKNLIETTTFLDKNMVIQGLNACANYSLHGAMYKDLQKALLHQLTQHIAVFDSSDLVDALNCFSHFGLKWSDLGVILPGAIQHKILTATFIQQSSQRHLSNFLWSASVLDIPASAMSSFETMIKSRIESFIESENTRLSKNMIVVDQFDLLVLTQTQQFILNYAFNIDTKYSAMIDFWLQKVPTDSKQSYLERDVLQVLGEVKQGIPSLKYETEKILLSYKPVDVYFEDKKLVLEINGEFHYNQQNEIRPKDEFNKKLIEKFGYKVIYLSEKDWRGAKDKKSFLMALLKEHLNLTAETQQKQEKPPGIKKKSRKPNKHRSRNQNKLFIPSKEGKEEIEEHPKDKKPFRP